MPSPHNILSGLTAIAVEWRNGAIAWHVVFGLLVLLLAIGGRPPARVVARVLTLAILSVSLTGWAAGNPFNGLVFATLALTLFAITYRLPASPIEIAQHWRVLLGAVFLTFAWIYPHFVEAESWLAYLYAPPLGLIPCPTLAAVIGVTLIVADDRWSQWSAVLSLVAIGYGLIGVLVLRVWIDAWLLLGAATLAATVVWRHASSDRLHGDRVALQ